MTTTTAAPVTGPPAGTVVTVRRPGFGMIATVLGTHKHTGRLVVMPHGDRRGWVFVSDGDTITVQTWTGDTVDWQQARRNARYVLAEPATHLGTCEACGATPTESCTPDCLGVAAALDTVPMPRSCATCEAPTVRHDACTYCTRYGRPCGRHDRHAH